MALTRPVNLFGRTRLHVYASDTTTSLGTIRGQGTSGTHSKAFTDSGLSFTVSVAEALLAADETVLEGAFVVPEVEYAAGWLPFATPYLLAPGTGKQRGGDSRRTLSPVAVGALSGLLEECIIFPTEADADHPSFRRCGGVEGNRYFNFASKGYSESLHTWNDADVYDVNSTGTLAGSATATASTDVFALTAHGLADDDRVRLDVTSGAAGVDGVTAYTASVIDADSFTLSDSRGSVNVTTDGTVDVYANPARKFGKPDDWPEALDDAEWVFRDVAEGGRTCARAADTFTLADDQRVVFVLCADENAKGFLDGPNHGGCIIDWTADEDGYNQGHGRWSQRLKAGTYRFGAHMLSINSDGGDGNDSMRFGAYSIKTDGSGDVDQVLFVSGADTRVLRQPITDQIPGMSPGEVMRRALAVNSDLGSEAADLLLANRTFTDTLDTTDDAWTTFVEWVWPHRTSLASAFADLLAEIDLDMGTSFTFDAWQDRGSDLSATVKLTPGAASITAAMNIVSYTSESDIGGPNAYMTESQEGSGLYEGTVPAGERRRFGSLESGASGTVARANRNARKAVKANGSARRHYDCDAIAVTGSIPWVSFTLCDVIDGRDYLDTATDLETTALSWAMSDAMKATVTLTEAAP